MQEEKKGKREGWTRKRKMTKMINMTNKERALSKDFSALLAGVFKTRQACSYSVHCAVSWSLSPAFPSKAFSLTFRVVTSEQAPMNKEKESGKV